MVQNFEVIGLPKVVSKAFELNNSVLQSLGHAKQHEENEKFPVINED